MHQNIQILFFSNQILFCIYNIMVFVLYWYENIVTFKVVSVLETSPFAILLLRFLILIAFSLTPAKIICTLCNFTEQNHCCSGIWMFYSKILLRNVLFVVYAKGRLDEGNDLLYQWVCMWNTHLVYGVMLKWSRKI